MYNCMFSAAWCRRNTGMLSGCPAMSPCRGLQEISRPREVEVTLGITRLQCVYQDVTALHIVLSNKGFVNLPLKCTSSQHLLRVCFHHCGWLVVVFLT